MIKKITLNEFIENYYQYANDEVEIKFPKKQFDVSCQLREFCASEVTDKYCEAWGILLGQLPVYLLSDDILAFLVLHKIQLNLLGHLDISDDWLLKTYESDNSCDEALETIGLRHLSEKHTAEEFAEFISKYANETLCDFLLKQAICTKNHTSRILDKYDILIGKVISDFGTDSDIRKYAERVGKYFTVLYEENPEVLKKAFESNDYLQLLALSQNPNSTEEILRDLTDLQNIKFGKRIRENSKSLLHKRI